jgi:hypothetical protein
MFCQFKRSSAFTLKRAKFPSGDFSSTHRRE